MKSEKVIELAKKAGLPTSMFEADTQLGDELREFVKLIWNEAHNPEADRLLEDALFALEEARYEYGACCFQEIEDISKYLGKV